MGVNIVPLVVAAIAIIPMLIFDLNEEKMEKVRGELKERREALLNE